MVLDCLFQTTRKIFMLQYSNAHWHVRPKGKSGWEISQHETIVSGGRNYRYRNSASTRTLTIARAIHNFLRPGTFCRLCLAIAADQRSYTSLYIYIYVYTYIIFLLWKSGWNSFWTLAHVRKKAHVLVRAFTGLHYTHRKRHKATMAGCFGNKTGDALLFRCSKECLCAFLVSLPVLLLAHTTKSHYSFLALFRVHLSKKGEAAAAETRQTQKLKKERQKESQQHTKAATQPHPVWTVSRPDPKVQHLSTKRCRTALQLFTPVMPTISLYSFLRDRPQTYSLKKRAQQVPTKRLTKGLCDNAAMPAEIADRIAHHSRSHLLGARAIRDFTKTWAVMAPQNWVPTVEDAGCEGFFKEEGSAGKKSSWGSRQTE